MVLFDLKYMIIKLWQVFFRNFSLYFWVLCCSAVFDDLLVFSIGLSGAKWFCNLSLTIDILGFVVLVDLKFI